MEELLKQFAEYIALSIEAIAAFVIAAGAIQAGIGLLPIHSLKLPRKEVWQRFAVWLILALEFMLAADILRTVISPSWDQLGQLGAIAVIRTFLNYFLEKDLEKYAESKEARSA